MPVRPSKKKTSGNAKLPTIKCCRCGAEIILIPNVKLMSEAIEAHVEKHRLRVGESVEAEAEADQIRDDLIKQVFDKVTEK